MLKLENEFPQFGNFSRTRIYTYRESPTPTKVDITAGSVVERFIEKFLIIIDTSVK